MKKLLSFFLIIFFVGCATHKEVVSKPKPLPSWYLNPPKSDNKFVYVTGSGIDKKHAILDALSNFISRYSITISSKFESKVASFGGGLSSKSSRQNIEAIVKKFEVSNYEVVKAERYSFDKFFVLLKIDLKALYNNLKEKLDSRFKIYKMEFVSISKKDLLTQYIELQNLYKKLEKEKNYIFILKLMNDSFNEKKYLDFISTVKKRILYVKSNLYVEIKGDNESILKDIEHYLSMKGIKIGKSDIKMYVKTEKKENSNYVRLNIYHIYISVKYKNSLIATNSFKVILPSSVELNGKLFDNIKNLSLRQFFNIN
jgi:hypothetical protein